MVYDGMRGVYACVHVCVVLSVLATAVRRWEEGGDGNDECILLAAGLVAW